jgi:hypothetical protein
LKETGDRQIEQQNKGQMHRSRVLTASAELLIISSVVALIGGVFAFYVTSLSPLYKYYFPSTDGSAFTLLMVVGIFGVLGFPLGLDAGVQCLRRKHFDRSFAEATFLLFTGVLHFAATIVFPYGGAVVFTLFFGTPITVLTLLGLVFLALRKSEFS